MFSKIYFRNSTNIGLRLLAKSRAIINLNNRSLQMFFKNGVLKDFVVFAGNTCDGVSI